MRKFKRILSILLIAAILIPMMPIGELVAWAEGVSVTRIEVGVTMEGLKGNKQYIINIIGSNLNLAEITYNVDGDFTDREMPSQGSGGNNRRQYVFDSGETITRLNIGAESYNISENEMPRISKVTNGAREDITQFDLGGDEDKVIMEGFNLDKIDQEGISIQMGTQSIRNDLKDNKFEFSKDRLRELGAGVKNITIRKTTSQKVGEKEVAIELTYLQNNLFRIYESIGIDSSNITIYPNSGKVGSPLEVTINNSRDLKYSIFFKEDDNDFYRVKNMGENHEYPRTQDNKSIIKLNVPKRVEAGKMYKLYMTNNLDRESQGKDPDHDLTSLVTQEQYIGEFYVVDSKIGPIIESVDPKKGSSDGSYVSIHGKRLEELSIPGLSLEGKSIANKEVLKSSGNDRSQLRIEYDINENQNLTYNDKKVASVTRDFLVTIGGNATFDENTLEKQEFNFGDAADDTLYVKTSTMSQEDLINPVKDVVVLITTTIETEGDDKQIFTELAILEKGYEFLVSTQEPIIDRVNPDKIQVNSISDKRTKEDTILSIEGEKFNVFRYRDGSALKTNYPKVVIGGRDEESGEIVVEKTPEGEINYYKDSTKIEISEESKKNIVFNVLDKTGNIVDGVGGNEEGTSIVLTIPKNISIDKNNINDELPIAVSNPKRDEETRGRYAYKNDMISFVTSDRSPSIESVIPFSVTTVGGEDIVIEGTGFNDGIKVFIAGQEVQGVKRDIDKITTKGTLSFKAPSGRAGSTILMVQNLDGGLDTHEFIYVESENIDPKLNSIIPDKGTEDDIIILRGDNFLKPDPTIKDLSGIGIDRLIGTRVEFDGIDINEYNSGKRLEKYYAPTSFNDYLIKKEENPLIGVTELKLGKAYRNATIKSDDKIYTIRKNRAGTMDIAGDDNIYSFYLEDSNIKARDEEGKEYGVIVEIDKIILESLNESEETTFDISYNFDIISIVEDERGSKSLKLADYYNSIYLKDIDNDKYFVINRDEKGEISLTDGGTENYILKISGNEIYAENQKLTIGNDSISLGDRKLEFMTPYKQEGNIIVGNRVEVIHKGEIEVRVPRKELTKKYNVTVRNPDTKSDTIRNGFEYISSGEQPEIHYIEPSEGSIDGGYVITIGGARFSKDTKVLIDGVPGTNVVVDQQNYSSLKVTVPKYRGTEEDFVTQKKFVRVHVITTAGQASTKEMFAYRLTSSQPSIRLLDTKGSIAGGKIIRLVGKDIRFYEPYKGSTAPTASSVPGVDYEDINGDRKWTNILSDKQKEADPKPLVPPTPDYDTYLSSPILPEIRFGNHRAKIVEFERQGDEYFIQVVLPESNEPGMVDVVLSNNDRAQSNKVRFTYESSSPNIKSIVPPSGRRVGGEKRDIEASGYVQSEIRVIDKDGKERETTMNMVRFGNISNKNTNIDDVDVGGRIRNGNALVNFKESKLKVQLKDKKVTLTLTETEDYIGTYDLSEGTKYIDTGSLKGKESQENYKGSELVKISIKPEGKLEVERGYSPSVKLRTEGILETVVPSYYKTEQVDVVLVNKDGESNKIKFQYTNPNSQPKVTNILRDNIQPRPGSDGNEMVQQISAKGGSIITVEGSDFRTNPNPTIIIGNNDIVIPPSDITFVSDKILTFVMPKVNENLAGRYLNLIVQNDDKGTGQSGDNIPPLYVQIITGETDPSAGNIDPDRGPVTGGTIVTITGTDFREEVDGYDGEFRIYFGENQVRKEDIISFSYDKIVLRVPRGENPGRVPVRIVNPDETPTDSNIFFTYISKPKIKDTDPRKLFTNDTETEVTLTGEQFMSGAKVIVGGKIIPTKDVKPDMVLNGSGITGVDRDGNNIESSVVGGKETAKVVFENDGTLKVTFTEAVDLENTSLIVINPDGGISEPYNDFQYELPLPLRPIILEAIPGYESTVMLIWNESDPDILNQATDYEIYGRKVADSTNVFVGTTKGAEFLVKGLEPNTRYEFLVRALNEYGSAIDFATVRVTTLSREEDYKQKEKEDKLKEEEQNLELKGKETIEGSKVIKVLGKQDIVNGASLIDFGIEKYKDINEYIIQIPLDLARTDSMLTIKNSVLNMNINPKNLYNYQVAAMDNGDKDFNLEIIIKKGRETNVPRGKKVASEAYELDFMFQRGKDRFSIDELVNPGNITLSANPFLYTNIKNPYLGVFNIGKGVYEKPGNTTTTTFKKKGKYVLLSDR